MRCSWKTEIKMQQEMTKEDEMIKSTRPVTSRAANVILDVPNNEL